MGCDRQWTNAQENTSCNTAALTRYSEHFIYLIRHHILLSLFIFDSEEFIGAPLLINSGNIVRQSTSHADQFCNSLPWKPEISIAVLNLALLRTHLLQ